MKKRVSLLQTRLAQTKLVQAKPALNRLAQSKPAQTKLVQSKPALNKLTQNKPAQSNQCRPSSLRLSSLHLCRSCTKSFSSLAETARSLYWSSVGTSLNLYRTLVEPLLNHF